MKTEELLRLLETKELALFGVGFVAEMFYTALESLGLTARLRFAVVSDAQEGLSFHGRPVFSLREAAFSKDTLLCLAVHESAKRELSAVFKERDIHSVWIYPNLFELLYGTPVLETASLPLTGLLSKQSREDYWLAVRYAAVRDYLRNEKTYPETCEVYRRAISLHCGYETAVRRNTLMETLASSMAEEGFRQDSPVKIDEAGRIIDGLHRTACAAFLGIEHIPAVVYPALPVYERLLGERNRLPERVLLDAGFSAEELRFLKEARDELLNGDGRPCPGRIDGIENMI